MGIYLSISLPAPQTETVNGGGKGNSTGMLCAFQVVLNSPIATFLLHSQSTSVVPASFSAVFGPCSDQMSELSGVRRGGVQEEAEGGRHQRQPRAGLGSIGPHSRC